MFLLVQTVIYVHKNAIATIKIRPQNVTRSGILTLLSHINFVFNQCIVYDHPLLKSIYNIGNEEKIGATTKKKLITLHNRT